MNKAEEFIQQNTKDSTNKSLKNGEYYLWLTPSEARRAVEIAREEMMEKVCNFVSEKLFFKDNMLYTNIKSKIVEDIKQVMKDE